MSSRVSRRALLRRGAAVTAPLLSGCLGGSEPTPTEPETERYGLSFRNGADQPMSVRTVVKRPDSGELLWETELTLDGKATRQFDGVVTEPVEQVVIAELLSVTETARVEAYHTQSNFWITPGAEDAPTVEDLKVITNIVDNQYSPKLRYVVGVTHEESDTTPWSGP